MDKSASEVENSIRKFYDEVGWTSDAGASVDAALWEDLRPVARPYVSTCRLRVAQVLRHTTGQRILDAASGPIQYPEYLEYSKNFSKRYCVDLSESALQQAKTRLGEKGEYVLASILKLPFENHFFDATISLHTIYHIEKEHQAQAVRELIRVTRPGQPIVIVYANPNRPSSLIKQWALKLLRRNPATATSGPVYYFAHTLGWWNQFSDTCEVKILPWRSMTAALSKRLIPNNALGKFVFWGVLQCEALFPRLMLHIGAYPMVVLRKKP